METVEDFLGEGKNEEEKVTMRLVSMNVGDTYTFVLDNEVIYDKWFQDGTAFVLLGTQLEDEAE